LIYAERTLPLRVRHARDRVVELRGRSVLADCALATCAAKPMPAED